MVLVKNSKQVRRLIGISFLSGVFITAFMMRFIFAGPLEVPEDLNPSDKPVFKNASYVPHTLAALAVRSDPEDKNSKPVVIVVGQLVVEAVMPGTNKSSKGQAVAYMYVTERDLKRFPTALEAAKRDQMACEVLDAEDLIMSRLKLKKFYAQVHDSTTADAAPTVD